MGLRNTKPSAKSTEHLENNAVEKKKRKSIILLRRESTFNPANKSISDFDVAATPPVITDLQRDILVESFSTLKLHISQIGVLLFMGLFETHPQIQGFFGNFKDCPPENLPESKELRQHALRVMGFVEKCISRIYMTDKLDAIIKELGERHASYGAPSEFFPFVGPQFICAIRLSLQMKWDDETENAWLALFTYIAHGMKQAAAI
ncbi:globin-like [Paramacrobiotus metropolitanus]|uniref:globin-like n=1 Tax=Paramacrobiotus metropolitanus TaxID=2943436 RepID=UPI0024458C0C|nr:globin-like [Paramacrobiotus metropolitanus]